MEIQVGRVSHYYDRIGVAVLDLSGELELGDTIRILGHTTEFTQQVYSMEIEHRKVQSVGPGMDVALKVVEPVHKGDSVFKVIEDTL
jgi:putative protease